jgi:hypothetical protein
MAASADAAPSYWDTIVHNPTGVDLNGDMIIEELPTGSVLVFALTALISWFFQLPGFILSYLLHTTHAGRFGSQAGLALTLIQWGFGSSTVMGPFPPPDEPPPPGLGPPAGGPPPGGPPADGWKAEDGMIGNSTMMDGDDSALGDMLYSGQMDILLSHDSGLVPASHILDWVFPRETFRIVCPRIARCPFVVNVVVNVIGNVGGRNRF